MPNAEDLDASKKQKDRNDDVGFPAERLSHESVYNSNAPPSQEVSLTLLKCALFFFLITFIFIYSLEYENSFFHLFDICFITIFFFQDGFNDIHDLGSSLPFPIKPLQALKYVPFF